MSPPPLAIHDLSGVGPTFVIVHGFTGSSQDFIDVAPRLTDLRRVLLIDQLGHGASPRAATYTYDALTAAVTAALEPLGGPVDLLGHSLGGRVVLPIAIQRPELVRSLVLMDTWAAEPNRGDAGAVFAEALAAGESMAAALERYDAARPDLEAALIAARRGRGWDRARLDHNAARVDPAAVEQLARQVLLDDSSLLEESQRLRCPVTVLVGQLDTPFLEPSRRLEAAIPHARLVVVDGAFHSPQLSHPDEWEHAIRRHLKDIDAAAG